MKCIIPAAGYGSRMGMKPGQSKEMLKDPHHTNSNSKPIIAWALELCNIFKMEPLVITRKEKQDLRQYLFNENVKFMDIEVEGEWYDSVLKSVDHWEEKNMLILPDTRFSSLKCIQNMQNSLELGNKSIWALHKVKDPENWGIIKDYMMFEKPKNLQGEQWAWGLMGFQKFEGEAIFSSMKRSHYYLEEAGFTFLDKFEDITRNK